MRSVSAAKPARSRTLQPASPRTRCSSPARSTVATSANSPMRRPRALPLAFLQRVQLFLRLAQVVLELLDLAQISLMRLRLHVADHGERPRCARAAAQPDEGRVARKLVHQRLRERDVAVARDHDPLPE